MYCCAVRERVAWKNEQLFWDRRLHCIKGIPELLASALLIGAIVVLIVGSLLLVFGNNTILGASLLLIFLVPTTLIFHTNPLDLPHLFPNLAVIGALILAMTRSTAGSVPSFRSLRARRR